MTRASSIQMIDWMMAFIYKNKFWMTNYLKIAAHHNHKTPLWPPSRKKEVNSIKKFSQLFANLIKFWLPTIMNEKLYFIHKKPSNF